MNPPRLIVAIAVLAAQVGSPGTTSAASDPPFDVQAHARALKALEQQIVMEEMKERVEELRSRRKAARGQRPRRAPGSAERGNTPAVTGSPARASTSAYPNALVNNRAADRVLGSAQSEVSIAAHGNNVVVSWNDGEMIPSAIQGFGYSTD